MRVLVACEYSGTVREAFRKLGHDAWSCDIIPSDDNSPYHFQCDVFEVVNQGWDLMIAHPPCTHLAVSGAKHFHKKINEQKDALEFVKKLMDLNIKKICIENPVSVISTKIRKPDQIIQPWQFGHEAQKTTCLWLKGLPLLMHTKIVNKGEFYISPSGKKLPKWYSDNKSAKIRSKTFQGIADAMAEQWGRNE
jgi:site-specific DNA-cytosine methylase